MLLMSFRSIKVREQGSAAPPGFAAAPGAGPLGVSLAKLFSFCLGAYGEAIVPSPMLTTAPGRDGQPAREVVHSAGPPSCRQEFSLADPAAHWRLRTIVADMLRTRSRHVSWLHGGEMAGVDLGAATTAAVGAARWPERHPPRLALTAPPLATAGVGVATAGGGAGAGAAGTQRRGVRYWCPVRGCGYSTPRRYNLKIHSGKVGATVGEEGGARGGGLCDSGGPLQKHRGGAPVDPRHATNYLPRLLLCGRRHAQRLALWMTLRVPGAGWLAPHSTGRRRPFTAPSPAVRSASSGGAPCSTTLIRARTRRCRGGRALPRPMKCRRRREPARRRRMGTPTGTGGPVRRPHEAGPGRTWCCTRAPRQPQSASPSLPKQSARKAACQCRPRFCLLRQSKPWRRCVQPSHRLYWLQWPKSPVRALTCMSTFKDSARLFENVTSAASL